MTDQKRSFLEVPLEEAYGYKLPHPGIEGPLTQDGSECPWPWEPLSLKDKPIGMYNCNYCGEMAVAGVPHPDWRNL